MAAESKGKVLGLSLTRQGDILVLAGGDLAYSYRSGRWQYWNHQFLRMLRERAHAAESLARQQAVLRTYDAALDVSFRRSGGLFVIVSDPKHLGDFVADPDIIGNEEREEVDRDFDREFERAKHVKNIPRQVLVRLAGLDGAVVTDRAGIMLAYGAILRMPKGTASEREEGSHTKAAIAASKYGVAVKISSDGDIKCHENGEVFLAF